MNAKQLKNSILQLAVQGKLVPQDNNDEPASILIKRIREEKERLIKEKKIKPDKNPSYIFRGSNNLPYEKVGKNEPVCIVDEVPFDIPDSWEWVRLGNICMLSDGEKIKDKNLPILDAKFLRGKSIGKNTNSGKFVKEGMTIILVDGENSGEIFIAPEDGYLGSTFKILSFSDEINIDYVLKFIENNKEFLKNSKKGAAIPHLNKDLFFNLFLGLPPLSEQQRIVDKIKELEPYINDYDKAYEKIEKLNTDFPDLLKKSILQEAVQGKLVPQDNNDEPASVLIKQIRKEKEQLIKDKKIKKDKNESCIFRRDNSHYEKIGTQERCIDDEIPFDIPDSWEWVRLGSILEKLTDGTHSTPKYTEHGIPFISVKDISQGNISFKGTKFITEEEHKELYKRCDPKKGDILLTKVGTTGIPVIVDTDKEFSLFVSIAQLRFNHKFINPEYLKYLILSPLVQKQCKENTKGVGNKNWVMRNIANTLIVIPPFNEQKRIVDKIENLLPKIKDLK